MSDKKFATVEEELAYLRKRVKELETEKNGVSGWLITTPNPNYSAQTMNIQFRKGMAFVPDRMDGERIARMMTQEFGYSIEHVEDFAMLPEDSQVRRSMIDMLMVPEQR
jgi:hypothetical protein